MANEKLFKRLPQAKAPPPATETEAVVVSEPKVVDHQTRKKLSVFTVVFVMGGLCLLSVAGLLLFGLFYSAGNSDLLARIMEPFSANSLPELVTVTPVPKPTESLPEVQSGGTDQEGNSLDSQCIPGSPSISFRGPLKVGSKEWFDALPKETESGVSICVNVWDYQTFLPYSNVFKGKPFDGQTLTGLEVLAHHYSYESVGSDSRFEELKQALSALIPATFTTPEGIKVQAEDTAYVQLPGYQKQSESAPPPQSICPEGNCFEEPVIPPQPTRTPTPTPFQPMLVTLTPNAPILVTPTPPYVDMQTVPTLVQVFTPRPQAATAVQSISDDEWLRLYAMAEKYQGEHCENIYNDLNFYTMSASTAWAFTTQLDFGYSQFGWIVRGNRRDVYVESSGNLYPVYSVCGQITNMPDVSNIDGNGTSWKGGAARLQPPGNPDPLTGLYQEGGTYWANVYGLWLADVTPKPAAFAPTATVTPTETPRPTIGTLDLMSAINTDTPAGQFSAWFAVSSGVGTDASGNILMDGPIQRYNVNFGGYAGHIRVLPGVRVAVTSCTSPIAIQYGGYKIAENALQNDWCIVPGQ